MAKDSKHWKDALRSLKQGAPSSAAARGGAIAATQGRAKPGSKLGGAEFTRDQRRYLKNEVSTNAAVRVEKGVMVVRRSGSQDVRERRASSVTANPPPRQQNSIAAASRRSDPHQPRLTSVPVHFRGRADAKRSADDILVSGIPLHPQPAGRKGKIRVILGLDFGTAYTKVVVNIANDRYAIPFNSVVDCHHPFLLPAVVSADGTGRAHLGRHPDATQTFEDLKVHLIEGVDAEERDVAYAAYMALVIRAARAWIFTEKWAQLRSEIDWAFHIGMPTGPWERGPMRNRYHELLEAACLASSFQREVTLSECRTVLRTIRKRPSPFKDRVAVYAEFAAQITGYVHSPSVLDGPHLLVDVGAGTLDVTMFNVFSVADIEALSAELGMAADVRFPIWDAKVEPLGTYYLVAACRRRDVDAGGKSAVETESLDSLEFYCARTGDDRKAVERLERDFEKRAAGLVAQVIRRTKVERYARFPWSRSEVPTFLCGGGARYPLYRRVLVQAAEVFPVRLRPVELEVPATLTAQGIGKDVFDRLSVAYGLSHEDPEIGEIRPSWQIEDQSRSRNSGSSGVTRHVNMGIDLTDRDQSE